MSLPRIIVIDDQYGGFRRGGRNRLRENFCLLAGLQDVTGDVSAEQQGNPVAEAVFCRGQIEDGSKIGNDPEGTLEAIRSGWRQSSRWAMLFLDLHFKTGPVGDDGEPMGVARDRDARQYFGLTLLERIWRDPELRDVPIVVLSSMDRDEVEHRFASDERSVAEFIDKTDLDRERLSRALWDHGLIMDDRIIGRSVALLKCLQEARRRAKLGNDNILLLGETGTGKELLARYVHESSCRAGHPYVTVYTQGVPEGLVEDSLFGHEKGAFTGAVATRQGAAENADGGTLFIDEFGDVPAAIQPKLLRLLDKNIRETRRLGAQKTVRLDLQVVLATNRLALLSSGDFRQDLLFRAKADEPVLLPPLQERLEDIPLLAEHFLRKYETQFKTSLETERRDIGPDVMDLLRSHPWPGNVRQLERVIESAVYRWPKLRRLATAHLNMPPDHQGAHRSAMSSRSEERVDVSTSLAPRDLLRLIDQANFDPADPASWAGLAPELQKIFARFYAKLLKAALTATRKSTAANPEGEIKIHPAMKLVMRNDKLTASKAADLVKRVMSLDTTVLEQLMSDPILSEAYGIAVRLRPKGGRK